MSSWLVGWARAISGAMSQVASSDSRAPSRSPRASRDRLMFVCSGPTRVAGSVNPPRIQGARRAACRCGDLEGGWRGPFPRR